MSVTQVNQGQWCHWPRVGNSLFDFSSKLPIFCEQKSVIAIHSFFWKNRSLKKSEWAKSDQSDSLLGIKRGKMMKNKRKIRILANPLFYKCFTWITSDLLTLLFCKEQRQRHLWSLFKMSNLSKRAKREWAKEQITNPALTGFSQSQQSLTAWCHWNG